MALLASTTTREGAVMMQAGIMLHIEATGLNKQNNYNWTTSADFGGIDASPESEAHLQHYVYIALKPLSREVEVTAESAPAQEVAAESTPAQEVTAASAHAHGTCPETGLAVEEYLGGLD